MYFVQNAVKRTSYQNKINSQYNKTGGGFYVDLQANFQFAFARKAVPVIFETL